MKFTKKNNTQTKKKINLFRQKQALLESQDFNFHDGSSHSYLVNITRKKCFIRDKKKMYNYENSE